MVHSNIGDPRAHGRLEHPGDDLLDALGDWIGVRPAPA
jgi:hypothetical protein